MSITSDSSLCDFLGNGDGAYQCSKCGTTIYIPDPTQEPPALPCKQSLIRSDSEAPVSFGQKILNFASAVAGHVSSGMPRCTEEQIIKRHDICRECEFFKDDTCGKCGCPLTRNQQFVSKLAWADQECPVGKWGKEITSS